MKMKVTGGSLPRDDQLRAEAEEFKPQAAERGVDQYNETGRDAMVVKRGGWMLRRRRHRLYIVIQYSLP